MVSKYLFDGVNGYRQACDLVELLAHLVIVGLAFYIIAVTLIMTDYGVGGNSKSKSLIPMDLHLSSERHCSLADRFYMYIDTDTHEKTQYQGIAYSLLYFFFPIIYQTGYHVDKLPQLMVLEIQFEGKSPNVKEAQGNNLF